MNMKVRLIPRYRTRYYMQLNISNDDDYKIPK